MILCWASFIGTPLPDKAYATWLLKDQIMYVYGCTLKIEETVIIKSCYYCKFC